tara:strand:+ start:1915 stop:2130 length:216 start_codon:yes stop_codon:yes gene_type:complete
MEDDEIKNINQRLTEIESTIEQIKAAVNELYELTALDTICRDVIGSDQALSTALEELLALTAQIDEPVGDA